MEVLNSNHTHLTAKVYAVLGALGVIMVISIVNGAFGVSCGVFFGVSWVWLLIFCANAFIMLIVLQLYFQVQQLFFDKKRTLEVLDHMPAGIMVTDESGEMIFANRFYMDKISPLVQEELIHPLPVPDSILEVFSFLHEKISSGSREIHREFPKGHLIFKAFLVDSPPQTVLWFFEQMQETSHETKSAFNPFSVETAKEDKRNNSQCAQCAEYAQCGQYDLVFQDSPTGVAILSKENELLKVNRAFAVISGLHEKELVGKTLDDLLTPESAVKVKLRLDSPLNTTRPQIPLDITLKDSPDKAIHLYYSGLTREGKESRRIIHFIDSSEGKKLEAQFVQSQKMQAIGQLAGGIAHDFNNLLTAMIGFCDLLLLRHVPGDQSFSDIMHIKQNANRAATLVRQLLAFSRQQTLQAKVMNLNDAIGDLCVLMRRLLGANVDLKVIHSPHIGTIKADLGQIEQVLVNLCVNARDSMTSGGILTIRTLPYHVLEPLEMDNEIIPPGKYVSIEIEDTGSGIPKEILSRIFEPFFSTKPVGKGTGLGLATVYGIVKQTGGFIKVESQLNKGSIFRVFLPEYEESLRPTLIPLEEQVTKTGGDLSGSASILLVEDEESVRMFGSRALRDKGYQVFEASCGEEALEFISNTQEKIDLIITDVIMPRVDGPALVNELKKRNLNFKVIFISGYMEDSFRQQLTSEENVHFLLKPFNLRDFALKVKSVLEGKD